MRIVLSLETSGPLGDRGVQLVDLQGMAASASDEAVVDRAGARQLLASLGRARDAGGAVAIQGFAVPRAGRMPLTFTLAASLAEGPYPTACFTSTLPVSSPTCSTRSRSPARFSPRRSSDTLVAPG